MSSEIKRLKESLDRGEYYSVAILKDGREIEIFPAELFLYQNGNDTGLAWVDSGWHGYNPNRSDHMEIGDLVSNSSGGWVLESGRGLFIEIEPADQPEWVNRDKPRAEAKAFIEEGFNITL